MLNLERVALDDGDWELMDAMEDRVVFQTRPWLDFLAETQGGDPVLAAVRDGATTVGWFTGMIIRRFGVRMLGSPLPGWGTGYMGFTLAPGLGRGEAIATLPAFARALGCQHLEVRDRAASDADVGRLGGRIEPFTTFDVDLSGDEDAVFGAMSSACRRAVRKAEKSGVVVEVADPDGFAEDYNDQLVEVFARQGLRPTYDVDRVRALVRRLHPSGRLLLLRARDPDGASIATALFPATGRVMYFWGGASRRSGQHLRPNEAVFWFAMRHWRDRGVETFDMGGGGEYKRKYGGMAVTIPHGTWSRFGLLWHAREWMRRRNDPDGPAGSGSASADGDDDGPAA